MKVREILKAVEGELKCGDALLDLEISYGFSSDLMSDVLTTTSDNLSLITGLANAQVIRTAEMSDISLIVFVRGKKVSEDMITLAKDNDIALIQTPLSMFKTSGILYAAGLKPLF
ncbi:MAG TPA: DRTGG domain-containing protein [Bacteroidales bacterium]|nr:DRTGG domain-containing protein [Bacteroidales bacterium]